MKVTFLGLGMMGSRMAANLHTAGHAVTVWNRTDSVAEEFAAAHPGVDVADTPERAGEDAEVVFSMVVDGAQVQELLLGSGGAAAGAGAGTLFIDCSTIGPQSARSIASDLHERGMRFLDAPVNGSTGRAEEGTLAFIVGGLRDDYERALPLLEVMGTLVLYAGETGKGQAIKVINNAVAAVNAAIVGQALLCGARLGADLDVLVAAMRAGGGDSAMLDLKNEAMRHHDYTPQFKLDHLLKDLRLCLEAGREAGFNFRFGDAIEEILAQASAMGHGNDDVAAMIEVLEASSDVRL
jgi:3-hydroxyisobutyrate dehydrogenase-like beta-hydroxyacid dehydrogenase